MAAIEHSFWRAIEMAVRLAIRANEEVRLLARALPNEKGIRALIDEAVSTKGLATDGLAQMVEDAVEKRLASLPQVTNSIGINKAYIDRSGELVLIYDDGRTESVGMVAGKDVDMNQLGEMIADAVMKIPKPRDGHDGIGVKEAIVDMNGSLILTLDDGSTKNAGVGFAKDITIDTIRGVIVETILENKKGQWEPGPYKKGNEVTYGGSRFLAMEDVEANDRPTTANSKWELINSRGRPGRDAEVKEIARPPLALPPKADE